MCLCGDVVGVKPHAKSEQLFVTVPVGTQGFVTVPVGTPLCSYGRRFLQFRLQGHLTYKKGTTLGPYRRLVPRVLVVFQGGGRFRMGEVPLYCRVCGLFTEGYTLHPITCATPCTLPSRRESHEQDELPPRK